MSSKDKENKTFQDKLKQFFRLNKSGSGNFKNRDFALTQEIEKEISPETALHHRTKAIKELSDAVLINRLEDKAIEKLWQCTEDLLSDVHGRETRHIEFHFVKCLVGGQAERLGLLRAHFFRLVKRPSPADDVIPRFDLLQSLTENGKYILHFEEEIGPFLLQWMPEVAAAGKTYDFLSMLVNVIKFNAAYIDEDVIAGIVTHTCLLCCNAAGQPATVLACLQVLDTIVCYSELPNESLPTFVAALCRTVNHEAFCQSSWKIMRNLLGTHLGHAALFTMCRALQEPLLSSDAGLLRGAVFHVNMALWGRARVPALRIPPAAVLPSFLQAAQSDHLIVINEVALAVQALVQRYGSELQDPAWDTALDVLESVVEHACSVPTSPVVPHLHDTLCTVEQLMELGQYAGSVRRVFDLIERCAPVRPELSVLRLLNYLATSIVPTRHLWLSKLHLLLERYFKQETRTNIRVKALDILSNVIKVNRGVYEDELMDRIVIVHLQNIATDPDVIVRNSTVNLLVNLALECDSKRCLELLDILDKLLQRPSEEGITTAEADTSSAALGLVRVFICKLHMQPTHAIRAFQLLVNHVETYYAGEHTDAACIRYHLLEALLKIRADFSNRIGYPDADGRVRYSPQMCIAGGCITQNCTNTHLSMTHVLRMLVTCLRQEKEWKVLQLVLQEMPKLMENKTLVLSKQGSSDIEPLAIALYDMVTDKTLGLPDTLRNVKLTRADFLTHILPALAGLASYHTHLDSSLQKRLVRCLALHIPHSSPRLASRCSRQCITALTTCALEMRDTMIKMLPEVLLNLSKLSATVHIAVPILEFLSTLTRLPNVFASFVADQYMSVFAMCMPYTNPLKYNHYTVSLAHHVIAMWFLKCRLALRRDFVKFITTGLKANTQTSLEEGVTMIGRTTTDLALLNEDSSNRKRSSSLTEQGSRGRRERPVQRLGAAALDLRPPVDEALTTFHSELTETCVDLMARYAFSPCSALPKRLPTADFLLAGGQSLTWILGNKLVTVTTSGCSQKVLRNGLCDKCLSMCKSDTSDTDTDSKRRSVLVHSTSGEDSQSSRVTRQNSAEIQKSSQGSPTEEKKDEKLEQLPGRLQQLLTTRIEQRTNERTLCACWCQGWAEIYIRRPTGDVSWVMRIQNQVNPQYDMPLNEMSTIYFPSLFRAGSELKSEQVRAPTPTLTSAPNTVSATNTVSGPINIPGSPFNQPSRQDSHESVDDFETDVYEESNKSRNPVRRSNSSPEMSASWKNPFLTQEKFEKMKSYDYVSNADSLNEMSQKKKSYGKDMRVSCEAIPEEISGLGTTPPAASNVQELENQTHPQLLSCHSYPGAVQSEVSSDNNTKHSVTVPSSPLADNNSDESHSPYERPKNLPPLIQPLSSKPPQSPTQTSPRPVRHITQSISVDGNNQPIRRDRGHTISVMSPVRKPKIRRNSPRSKEIPKSGINPSFVFLQLYHSAQFGTNDKPLLVGQSQVVQRGLQLLDTIPPYETHKIGVIYVGKGQCYDQVAILRNSFGSLRYVEFLQKLGTLIRLQDVDPQTYFLGGLEQNGMDGKFAYIWQDDVMQMVFHVATLMPCEQTDPSCNEKKKHIGNNYVTIVYNDSGDEYNMQTMKSEVNFACVVIEPLDHNTNRVTVKARDELAEHIGHSEPKIISDQNVAILARQLALHANLASMVSWSLTSRGHNPHASNWLERLRSIKRLRTKVLDSQDKSSTEIDILPKRSSQNVPMNDFTDYT